MNASRRKLRHENVLGSALDALLPLSSDDTALGHVNVRLAAEEATTKDLQEATQAMAVLQAEICRCMATSVAFKSQTAKLVLWQASYLVTNKLVRVFCKGKDGQMLTPSAACFINLNNLKNAKATNKEGLAAYLSDHPGLEVGLEQLANMFVGVAHLNQLPLGLIDDEDTSTSPITMDYLKMCLDQECSVLDDDLLAPIMSVLHSLADLSNMLNEDLFVSTVATTIKVTTGRIQCRVGQCGLTCVQLRAIARISTD